MPPVSRRLLLGRALALGGAAALIPVLAPRAAASCVDPDSESLRTSLNYASTTADATKACAGCAFFKAATENAPCGHCEIMSGPVDRSGTCDSWSPHD